MAGEAITWKDSGGTSHPFDGSANVLAVWGEQGKFMPPSTLLDQRTPLRPGTTIRYLDILPRPLTFPLVVQATSEVNLRTVIRNMTKWFYTPAGSPGTVIATAPDGSTQRQCTAYYVAGLEGDESDGNRGISMIQFPLQLEVPDPFWYDTSAQTVNYTGPFTTTQNPTITNAGDYLVWPKVTIHGPMTYLIWQNTVGGITYNLQISLTMLVTDVLVIDTLAGTITLNSTTNEIANVVLPSTLWSLAAGANNLGINLAGSTASTTIQVQYTNRWFSA